MKRLLLLLPLLATLAAPALTDDAAVTDLLVFSGITANDAGKIASDGDCLNGYSVLSFALIFTPPANTPDTYLIRWSARQNRTWRATDKDNTARAGNLTIKHADTDPVAGSRIVSAGSRMQVPVGQSILVQIRPFYGARKGTRSRAVINTPALVDKAYGSQAVNCA